IRDPDFCFMSYRPERLAHELKSEVSAIISRGLHDPRVGFATVTQVRVSPDLRHARVFVSIFEAAEKQRETLAALNHAAGFIRSEATSRLRLRRSPELVFALDESVERGDRMSRLIEEISQELSPKTPISPRTPARQLSTIFPIPIQSHPINNPSSRKAAGNPATPADRLLSGCGSSGCRQEVLILCSVRSLNLSKTTRASASLPTSGLMVTPLARHSRSSGSSADSARR